MITIGFTSQQFREQEFFSNYLIKEMETRIAKSLEAKTQLGEDVLLEDIYVVQNPELLQDLTSRYWALEVTPVCNVACHTCFNGSNQHQASREGLRFMDLDFARNLADVIGNNPYYGKSRVMAISGGEPTLNIDRTADISKLFVERGGLNDIVIISNGIVLPLDESRLEAELMKFDKRVRWQLSYNTPLANQYQRFKGQKNSDYQVPDSEDPLLSKISHIIKIANSMGVSMTIRVTEFDDENGELSRKVKQNIPDAESYVEIIRGIGAALLEKRSKRRDTSIPLNRDKLYVMSDGRLFPTMHHVGHPIPMGRLYDIRQATYH
jgi:uncharacterized Fe-S cluster-containing radical SAM superfamily protein